MQPETLQISKPEIKNVEPVKLFGLSMEMSLARHQPAELFKKFMPLRNTVTNKTKEIYSIQVYEKNSKMLAPDTIFTKWAAMELSDLNAMPAEFKPYTLPGGLYAVFEATGAEKKAAALYGYIFGQWLPESSYELDMRPLFEIVTENYRDQGTEAKEHIYIPIKEK